MRDFANMLEKQITVYQKSIWNQQMQFKSDPSFSRNTGKIKSDVIHNCLFQIPKKYLQSHILQTCFFFRPST